MTDRYSSEVFGHYLTTASAHRSDLSEEGIAKSRQAYQREFGAFLPSDKDAPILEIGCSVGGFLDFLAESGYQTVQGVEISHELVEVCHQRGHESVVCASGLDFLAGSDQRWATVVMIDVLEHLPKQAGLDLLKAIAACLQPEGRLVLRVPNMSNPLNLQARYGDFTHEVGYSKEALEQMLRIAGFEVESVHAAAGQHRNPLAKLVFDRMAWWAFQQFCRRTMQIRAQVLRGKNIIGVATPKAS
ncbi:MAG: class I SAM-dependent methyltransferase [Acidobacteriota bacterium]